MKCTVTVKLERPLTKGTLMAGLSSGTECWLSSAVIKPGMDSAVLSWATGLSDTEFYLEWVPGQNEDDVITDKELLKKVGQ